MTMRKSQLLTAGGLCLAVLLAACATAPEPPAPPLLSFEGQDCSSKVDLGEAIMLPDMSTKDGAKKMKRMMKNRTIMLSDNFNEDSRCVRLATGGTSPYALFEVPSNIQGQVIYAGSMIDSNSMFAANVSLLGADGNVMRQFTPKDFNRVGTRHAVQFSPRANEAYVLIKADPNLLGQKRETLETGVSQQTISVAYGGLVSSGTNLVGHQKAFDRSFSYDGEVGIRVVFPKQEEEKS
jgi:hypothetical protein